MINMEFNWEKSNQKHKDNKKKKLHKLKKQNLSKIN